MNIKDLELTENDFQLLIDGLEALPEKGAAGELLGALFIDMLNDKNADPVAMQKIKQEREERLRKQKIEKDAQKEDINILKGKLILLKRWLIGQGALKQVYDILER